jgi:transcription initiation factor IIF auxiliary subunit
MDIKQDEQYLGDSVGKDWWKWSVKLEGAPDELGKVDYVEYTLHPTFPEPVRYVDERESDFRLEAEGWGGFTIYANVVFKDGTQKQLEHELNLYYPDGTQTEK